jgi:chromosome segregation ATPase
MKTIFFWLLSFFCLNLLWPLPLVPGQDIQDTENLEYYFKEAQQAIVSLKSKVFSLKSLLKEKEAQEEAARAEITLLKQTNARLAEKLDGLKDKISSLEKAFKSKEIEYEALLAEFKQVAKEQLRKAKQQHLRELAGLNERFAREKKVLDEAFARLSAAFARLSAEKDNLAAEKDNLAAEKDKLLTQNQKLAQALEEAAGIRQNLQSRLEEQASRISSLQKALEDEKVHYNASLNKVKELLQASHARELQRLSVEFAQEKKLLEDDNARLQQQLEQAKSENQRLAQDISQLNDASNQAKAQLKKTLSQLSSLKSLLKQKETEYAASLADLKKSQQEKLARELEKLKTQYTEQLQKVNTRFAREKKVLAFARLSAEKDNLAAEKDNLAAEKDKLLTQNQKLAQALEEAVRIKQGLKSELNKQGEQVSSLKEAVLELKAEREEIKGQLRLTLERFSNEKTRFEQARQNLESALKEKDREINSLKGMLREKQLQQAVISAEFSRLKQKNLDLAKKLNEFNTQKALELVRLKAQGQQEFQELKSRFAEDKKVLEELRQSLNKAGQEKEDLKLTLREQEEKIKEQEEKIKSLQNILAEKSDRFAYLEKVQQENEELEHKIALLKDATRKERANLYYYLALAYTQAKVYEEAMKAYKRSLQYEPDNAQAHYNLGLLYQHYKGDSQRAIQHLRQYMKLNPEGPDYKKAEYLIKTLQKE